MATSGDLARLLLSRAAEDEAAARELLPVDRVTDAIIALYAGHDQPLGGASPLWRLMAPTTSRGQLRRREAGWEGSRRRNRDLRYANRIGGGAARASQQRVAKPDAIKRPSRKCGGCARKVAGLIPGDLRGCP